MDRLHRPSLSHPSLGHRSLGHPSLGHPSLGHAARRWDWPEVKVALAMLVVLAVVVAEAVHSGQAAWVLIGLIGPAVLAVAVVRDWPRRVRR